MSDTAECPQTPPAKVLIQMSGAPGSGKSTVARLLRPRLNGVVIDHDVLRSSLFEPGSESGAAAMPFKQAAKQAYRLQWALAGDMMAQGVGSVIVDSTCNYPEVLERCRTLAAQHGYEYWYVECRVADIDLLDRRLRARHTRMASQRSAVDCPPAAAWGRGARVGEGDAARALFARWIESPCRPDDDRVVIVVDSSTTNPEVLRDEILRQMAVNYQDKSAG